MAFPIAILAELALKVASSAFDKHTAKKEMERAIAADPVLKNELNAEAPYQSRVAIGSVVAALGVVAPPLLKLVGIDVAGSEIVEYGSAIMTLWGAGYALYGRFKSGLKPLFSRG